MATITCYTTKIAATKTAAEIQASLAEHGVTKIMTEFADGRPVGITFEAATEFGPRTFRLPVDVDAMALLLRQEKDRNQLPGISYNLATDRTHAERVAWRVIAEWINAQMTLVATRMATLDQVMLPYLVIDGDKSLYASYREQGLRQLTGGDGDD